jgi:ComF family protein
LEADRFVAADAGVVLGEKLLVAVAAFRYEGPLRRALGRLKYGGAARLAGPLARAAAPALAPLLELVAAIPEAAEPTPLVPVPIHPDRLRERGYNQAALLAAELARATSRPVADLLVRTRPTTKQHRLDRAGRLHNLRGAFAARKGVRPPPSVILVDDILTTSATLEACASALRGAGCETVLGIALAREV